MSQRQEPNREIVELALELVDFDIAFDNARGKLGIARHDGLDCRAELVFGKAAHFGDGVVELAKLLVISSGNMLGSHRLTSLLQPAQPNRPVI